MFLSRRRTIEGADLIPISRLTLPQRNWLSNLERQYEAKLQPIDQDQPLHYMQDKSKLLSYVIASGLTYGAGENIFHFLFKVCSCIQINNSMSVVCVCVCADGMAW